MSRVTAKVAEGGLDRREVLGVVIDDQDRWGPELRQLRRVQVVA
jgi:hypothetical protein